MSLTPPLKVGKLQTALHTKAKNSPDYRFYALYDKIYRRDVLGFAYRAAVPTPAHRGWTVRALRISRRAVPRDGWTIWRKSSGMRRISPCRSDACTSLNRMASPGRWGFPRMRIRSSSVRCLMVLEPVYETDFLDVSHGFRPGRGAHGALQSLWKQEMKLGGDWIVDVDLRKFFDTIDHGHLREFLKRRVRDGVILRLIGKWLNAGVLEEGDLNHPRRRYAPRRSDHAPNNVAKNLVGGLSQKGMD